VHLMWSTGDVLDGVSCVSSVLTHGISSAVLLVYEFSVDGASSGSSLGIGGSFSNKINRGAYA
jgi:hypothetical protein